MDSEQSINLPTPVVNAYLTGIGELKELISGASSEQKTDKIKHVFADVLEKRSQIQAAQESDAAIDEVLAIFEADSDLRKMGRGIISDNRINMYIWRKSAGVKDSQQWWWYLDHSNRTSLFWLGVTIFLFIMTLSYIINAINDVSTLMLQIFSNVGEEFVFDTFAILGAIFQLGIGGSISIAFTRRFLSELNQIFIHATAFKRIPNPVRYVVQWLLPVTSPFIIFTVFLATILITNIFIIPSMGDYYANRAEADLSRGSINSAIFNIDIALSTDNSSYANTLTLIGREYESIGQSELAIDAYQRALREDTTMLAARYSLANLLLNENIQIDVTKTLDAIRILDEGINQLVLHERGEFVIGSIESDDESETERLRVLFRYLLLVTRGRAFLQLNSGSAAMEDLLQVQDLIRDNEDLFITRSDFENDEQDLSDQVFTLSFYYYFALANEARQAEERDNGQQASGDLYGQCAFEAWETVILLSSEQNDNYQARLWNIQASQRIDSMSSLGSPCPS